MVSNTTAKTPACSSATASYQFPGGLQSLALRLKTAELIYRLGSETDVSHDRNTAVHDAFHRRGDAHAALQLDRLRTGFLNKTAAFAGLLSVLK